MTRSKKTANKMGATRAHNYFSITVKLIDTMETFHLKEVYNEMKIKELKEYAEFATGIPYNLQRLCYLDEGELLEHTDIKSNDIVSGALLKMRVWNTWKKLIEAAALGDSNLLFTLGVTQDTTYSTPNSEWMMPPSRRAWIRERANVALFVAAHRGHIKLCGQLVDKGADVDGRTALGHTALHVAAAQDHGFAVDLLLEKGADINATDNSGETALTIASKFGNKNCERHLFLFRWQQRAKDVKPVRKVDRFAHQYFDSAFPVWLKGNTAQVYYTKITPPSEFQGTALCAPKSMNRPPSAEADDQLDDGQKTVDMSEAEEPWLTEEELKDYSIGGKDTDRKKSGYMMPAIEEEPSLRSRTSASEQRSDISPKRPLSMPSKTTKGRSSTTSKKQQDRKESFDQWLLQKKVQEKQDRDEKREEELRKKYAEEDKKRLADFEDNFKSYDSWLAEKEGGDAGGATPSGPGKGRGRTVNVGVTGGAGVKSGPSAPSVRPQTTKTIIDNIIQRRKLDHLDSDDVDHQERPGGFEAWLTGSVHPSNILAHIRSGQRRESIVMDFT